MGAEDIDPNDPGVIRRKVRGYLDQIEIWPSLSKGDMPIEAMAPEHAYRAWRQVKAAFETEWKDIAARPLCITLMEQYIGTADGVLVVVPGVVYEATGMVPHQIDSTVAGKLLGNSQDPLDSEAALEVVFDALDVVDAEIAKRKLSGGSALHPIERARIVLANITDPPEREKA